MRADWPNESALVTTTRTQQAFSEASVREEDLVRVEAFSASSFRGVPLEEGRAHRRALDDALAEIAGGSNSPSPLWRQRYALLLGLEQLLAETPPRLNDGAVLNPHQVDALTGTLAALTAELEELVIGDNIEDGELEEEPQDFSDDDAAGEGQEDAGAARRFWFEHATGAGKTVAACGVVAGTPAGGVLILTHRRNLVDQFIGEIKTRGYGDRLSPPLMSGQPASLNPVTVETYQWFVRNHNHLSDAYAVVICDEAHTALGGKTSAAIRAYHGPVYIGMTATGQLIARHVTDLFPTQTSRFDLQEAAAAGVISPLRCLRISPGPGVRSLAKVQLRRGEVDQDFDQAELAALLDQGPFNIAIASLYAAKFSKVPGIIYTAGVAHAHNVASALQAEGIRAEAVSGETPKRELAQILADFEHGEIDVLCNAQLLAEGWNSPRATLCMHLAPTASRRVYQQRVGRVTRRAHGKDSGLVIDFVHPATRNDETIVTLHSLLDRDIYRGGAIVVGPVRPSRRRVVRVDKRLVPIAAAGHLRQEIIESDPWRIQASDLDYSDTQIWIKAAAQALQHWQQMASCLDLLDDQETSCQLLLEVIKTIKLDRDLRLRALKSLASLPCAEDFAQALAALEEWPRAERRRGATILLEALAARRIGKRNQAQRWVWRLAEMTRDRHELVATHACPEAKRLLGSLVNSSGKSHGQMARKFIKLAEAQDRPVRISLLAAALTHTPEAGNLLDGARNRVTRNPSSIAGELVKNLNSARRRRRRRSQPAIEE